MNKAATYLKTIIITIRDEPMTIRLKINTLIDQWFRKGNGLTNKPNIWDIVLKFQ